MPYLLIDIGNSYTKYTMVDKNGLSPVNIVESKQFFGLLTKGDMKIAESLAGIILVSVMDKASTNNIKNKLSQSFQCSVQQIETSAKALGVTCGYSDYTLLGADRWVAMIAAFARVKDRPQAEAILVVDCGTVVTADVVDSEGLHLGGWMMPGLSLMSSTLGQKSSGIHYGLNNSEPDVDPNLVNSHEQQKKSLIIGKSTQQCVDAGGKLAVVGFIEQCFRQTEKLSGFAPLCILAGGGAKELVPLLTMQVEYFPELVLDGLSLFIE